MTIFEDTLYQKYVTLINMEDVLRQSFLMWMNTQISYFDFGPSGKNIVEVKKVTYVQDCFEYKVEQNVSVNPNAIIRVIINSEHGFTDTIRRVPFSRFGRISERLIEEFQYFINFKHMLYEVCEEIHEKYMYKNVTDGTDTYKIAKIEYHAMPMFYTKPNILEKIIEPRKFWLI